MDPMDLPRNMTISLTDPISISISFMCRDPKDDKFIEAALAAGAGAIIARDRDLTVLEQPFGIAMRTPRSWLATLSRAERRRLAQPTALF